MKGRVPTDKPANLGGGSLTPAATPKADGDNLQRALKAEATVRRQDAFMTEINERLAKLEPQIETLGAEVERLHGIETTAAALFANARHHDEGCEQGCQGDHIIDLAVLCNLRDALAVKPA